MCVLYRVFQYLYMCSLYSLCYIISFFILNIFVTLRFLKTFVISSIFRYKYVHDIEFFIINVCVTSSFPIYVNVFVISFFVITMFVKSSFPLYTCSLHRVIQYKRIRYIEFLSYTCSLYRGSPVLPILIYNHLPVYFTYQTQMPSPFILRSNVFPTQL